MASRKVRRRPWWRSLLDGLVVVALAAALLAAAELIAPSDFSSNVSVVDGDSLRPRDGTADIRLHGIDAPEIGQLCSDAAGLKYDCGRRSRDHLRSLVAGGEVTCQTVNVDRYGRSIAVCKSGEVELNEQMVRDGWALAYRQHSSAFIAAELAAKESGKGIWHGEFDTPDLWRRIHRSGTGLNSPPD